MSKEKKPVEQQHVLHSGHDRFGSGVGKHLEIPLGPILKWRRGILQRERQWDCTCFSFGM